MDNFEQFFTENRLKLDVEPLPEGFNNQMIANFRAARRKKQAIRWFAAAGFLLLLVPGIMLLQPFFKPEPIALQESPSSAELSILTRLQPYQTEIESSTQFISQQRVPTEYSVQFQDFLIQLQIIDRQQDIYQKQIDSYGYTEDMIQQIMYNYELKLMVLQKLQTEILKINKLSKTTNHEYTNIQLEI